MNRNLLTTTILASGMTFTMSAHAVLFDQNVTPDVIFGAGNANGSYTVDRQAGVELGLRGKLRHNATGSPENTFNSNGDGTYSFVAGAATGQSASTAVWSFEWAINTDYDGTSGLSLDDLTYQLGVDSDPTAGTSFTLFDPINAGNPGAGGAVFWDHAIGNNGTSNGGGVSAVDATDYASLISVNNVAQQSWKAHWFLSAFDPAVDGTYDFFLSAANATGAEIARTHMQIIVGQGATAVPEPTTLLLFSAGLLGLGVGRKVRKG